MPIPDNDGSAAFWGSTMLRHTAKLLLFTLTALLMQMAVAGTALAAGAYEAQLAYDKGDFATAQRIYRDLAERGDAVSQYALGRMYARGEGAPKDADQARHWFGMARDQTKALRAYNEGDYATALQIYRPLAEKSQVLAEYVLGLMYANGQGVAENYGEALKWLQKAAEQGEAKAQFSVGVIYFKGLGTPANHAAASKWCRRSADQGNATALYNLGAMYAKGETVPRDPVTAYMMYSLAAKRGIIAAGAAKEQIAKSMTGAQVAEAEKRAREWKPKPEHAL
jgi:TPR repeat protein